MNGDDRISLTVLGSAERQIGRLATIRGIEAELHMDGGPPIPPGALVEFQNGQFLYLGQVEASANGSGNPMRVRIAHFLDLEKVAEIRKTWNVESTE